jgi:hypothetical protein
MKSRLWTWFCDRLLSPPRIWALAIILVGCLWSVCLVDFATPGVFDRAGNIKFQDFLQFPISARLIAQGRADQLYDDQVLADEIRATVGSDTRVYLQYFYGPQVAVPFIPLSELPFLTQALIWATISLVMYFACVYLVWKRCPALQRYGLLMVICALAYPPLFHFFVRGQLSAVVLACFTAAYLAFSDRREFLAGLFLGLLAFKPQFVVGIVAVLLLALAWKVFAGLAISAGLQLALTAIYFGRSVMREYLTRLMHSASHPASTELAFSTIQMHSLHSFWEILIPWRPGVWALYLVTSVAVIATAAKIWKSSAAVSHRFSALLLASVLVNPHIYIFDLLALAPAFLILTDWSLQNPQHHCQLPLKFLLHLALLLPLFGPIAHWTHLQLSVPVFAAILWTLRRMECSRVPALS